MKTAVSIPDDVFHQADAVAARLGWSRSQLYARAVREFLRDQGDDPVTAALDDLVDAMLEETETDAPFNAGRDLVARGYAEW